MITADDFPAFAVEYRDELKERPVAAHAPQTLGWRAIPVAVIRGHFAIADTARIHQATA